MFNNNINRKLLICSIIIFVVLISINNANAQFGADAGAILNQFLQQQSYDQFDRSLINPGLDQSKEPIITIQTTKAKIVSPQDKELLNRVKQRFDNSNFEYVLEISNKALQKHPDLIDLLLYRGAANYYLDNYNLALKDAQTYLASNPDSIKALLLKSAANLMLKDYKSSIRDCENVLKKEKNEKAYIVYG